MVVGRGVLTDLVVVGVASTNSAAVKTQNSPQTVDFIGFAVANGIEHTYD